MFDDDGGRGPGRQTVFISLLSPIRTTSRSFVPSETIQAQVQVHGGQTVGLTMAHKVVHLEYPHCGWQLQPNGTT